MTVRRRTTTLLMTALLVAGCTDTGTDGDAEQGPDASAQGDATTGQGDATTGQDDADAAGGEGDDDAVELTMLTHDSFDVSEDVIATFTEKTGVEVSIVPLGDAGTALNQTILTADAPQGDLLFGVDTSFLSRALDAELFTAYESPMLEHVDDRFVLDPEHRVTPVDFGDVCLNYDVPAYQQADLAVPEDLADLTDPRYEGQLVVMNPATSSPGLSFLLATIERFGEDGYLDYWEQLVANDVLVTDGWSEAYYDEFSGGGPGDRPLVVSYASSPPVAVKFADPQPETAPIGVIEASCFRQVEFVGILRGTEHEQQARQLVDFLLDEPFQEDVPTAMFVFPVNRDAQLPEVFAEHAVVPESPFEVDPFEISEHREAWIDAWTDVVLR